MKSRVLAAVQTVLVGAALLVAVGWTIDRVNAVESREMVNVRDAVDAVHSLSAGAAAPREPAVETPVSAGETAASAAAARSELGDLAMRFMKSRPGGRGRLDEEAWFREMAILAGDVTRGSRVDSELLLAVTFRESSWDPNAVGQAGELGLTQLKGAGVREGFTAAAVRSSPSLQLWLGVRHLERSLTQCGSLYSALLQYGTGNCDGPRCRDGNPTCLDYRRRAIDAVERVLTWRSRMREWR